MAVLFISGRVAFSLQDVTGSNRMVLSQQATYADNAFHVIEVRQLPQSLEVVVDGRDSSTVPFSGTLFTGSSRVFIGGISFVSCQCYVWNWDALGRCQVNVGLKR